MPIAIQAENISKRYRIRYSDSDGRAQTVGQGTGSAVQQFVRKLRGEKARYEDFWALREVSFELEEGGVLGLIGPNGAGKSTLLKILSRVTRPTEGHALIRGRVGSLLEVGTGFHPELTGRENVRLSASILGMHRAEIDRKFDEIVAFSGVERFLDTPVKRYSSGMFVRLAFSVAAHLEPEVLIVDEVLSVGDAAFQEKCLKKMAEIVRGGRTILFVSHNMVAVQRLCRQGIWLDQGRVVESGEVTGVVRKYMENAREAVEQLPTEVAWPDDDSAPGNEMLRVLRASVRPTDGTPSDPITIQTPLVIEVDYRNRRPQARLDISLHFWTDENVVAFGTGISDAQPHENALDEGLYRATCHIPDNLLNAGTLRVDLYVVEENTQASFKHQGLLSFTVFDDRRHRIGWYVKTGGVVRPLLRWEHERLESASAASPTDTPAKRQE